MHCLYIRQHLTSRVSFRPSCTQRATEIKNFFETAPLQRYTASCIVWLSVQSAILKTAHAHHTIYYTRCGQKQPLFSCVVLLERRSRFCELLLAMPPSKICPECDAVVPIRLKVCKSCQHVFRAKRKIEQSLAGKAMKWLQVVLPYSMKSVIKGKYKLQKCVKEQHSPASKICIDSSRAKST